MHDVYYVMKLFLKYFHNDIFHSELYWHTIQYIMCSALDVWNYALALVNEERIFLYDHNLK